MLPLETYFWCWHFVCLFPARAYSGSSVWQPAEAAPQPHRLHRVSAAGSGEGLPADAVPRCWHEREAGVLHQPAWSSYTGERAGCECTGVEVRARDADDDDGDEEWVEKQIELILL